MCLRQLYVIFAGVILGSALAAEPAPDVSDQLSAARKAWQAGDALEKTLRSALASNGDEYLKLQEKQDAYYEEAKRVYRKALEKSPKNSLAMAEFARFWISRRELGQARKLLDSALHTAKEAEAENTPALLTAGDRAELHRMLGGLMERAGEDRGAIDHYRTAFKLDENNLRNRISLGVALCASGLSQQALLILKPLSEPAAMPKETSSKAEQATFALGLYTLALAFEENGYLEEALTQYSRAAQFADKAANSDTVGVSEHAHLAVSRVEDQLDRIAANSEKRAKENEDRKTKNLPPLPDERQNFADACHLCDLAVKLKEQALDDQSFVEVVAKRRRSERDSDLVAKNPTYNDSFKPAMQMFQDAILKFPRLPRAYYQLASCNVILGQFGAARKLLDEASSLSPNNLAVLSLQGEVLLSLGQWEDALKAFKKLLALEPDSGRANFGIARASAGMQADLKQSRIGLDALDRAEQLGVPEQKALRHNLIALVQRFENGESSAPVPKIQGSSRPESRQGAPDPWKGTIFNP
jgi:tetratricopeptide (TPR) repeat protein